MQIIVAAITNILQYFVNYASKDDNESVFTFVSEVLENDLKW